MTMQMDQILDQMIDELEANTTITNGEAVKLALNHMQGSVVPLYEDQKTEKEILDMYEALSPEVLYKLSVGLKNLSNYIRTHYFATTGILTTKLRDDAEKRLAEAAAVTPTGT